MLVQAPSLTDRGNDLPEVVLVLPDSVMQDVSLLNSQRPGAQYLGEGSLCSCGHSHRWQTCSAGWHRASLEAEGAPATCDIRLDTKSQWSLTAGLPEPLLAAAVASSPQSLPHQQRSWSSIMSFLYQAAPVTSGAPHTRPAAARQRWTRRCVRGGQALGGKRPGPWPYEGT